MLKKFALGIIALVVLVNVVLVAITLFSNRGRDLSVSDTAVAWQEAVFGGNYEGMWDLAAPEFRDGLSREQFIEQAREEAPPQDRLFDWTVHNEVVGDVARVHTRVHLARAGIETHRMMMLNVDDEWRITEYESYAGPWPPEEPSLAES